jgi:hypothetical protein
MKTTSKITNLQQELLKIFSFELSEKQLLDVKDILASYFANAATHEMDKLWDEKKWTDKSMKKLAKEHLRTKYK